MAEDGVHWRQLGEFRDVDLSRSFVLSWAFEVSNLLIDIDLFLEPGHPFYESPRPAEKVCIRPALLEFPYCESLQGPFVDDATDLDDAVTRLGIGAMQDLVCRSDGRFELTGAFGTVTIDAERPILRLR